jgi:hypothetical protein
VDFAIANLPFGVSQKTLQLLNGSVSATNRACNSDAFDCPKNVKGDRRQSNDPLEHGQRPKVMAVRSVPMADEHPFPTSLLNHETSDHLLSLR